jgi:FlaA1/EpsC-like NDP-sugar epimerase
MYIPLISIVGFFSLKIMIVFFFGGSTYASFEETVTSTMSLTIVYIFLLALNSLFDVWQYVLINYFFAYTITLIALILIRIYSREKYNFINRFKSSGKKTVIYGAGSLGLLISKQIIKDSKSGIKILGFIDDNLKIRNYRINKFKVLGDFNKLKELHEKLGFELMLLTIKDINHLEKINSICEELKIELKIVPSLRLILNEGINYAEMKAVQLSDILGRKNISSTSSEIKTLIKDKKILVTGAGGSIGSEIVRQLHNYSPEIVGCLDRDESALHALELSLFGSGLLLSESMILADLRDQEAIDKAIEKYKPDIVFHAGALKHVVMLEKYPEEAYKTNVLGTKNLVQSCLKHGVELFLNISTDKAARPISVLGNTKLQAEKIVTDANLEISSNKKYLSVRFGNVLGSRGSFLDTFRFQIENGLPITITDKNVQRYFMTVEEAVFLVLQSAAIGPKGSVLFLDMGNPVRIEDVAKKLITQSGKDIEIKYSGLRKGEKIDEVLFDIDTQICELIQPGIFQIKDKTK